MFMLWMVLLMMVERIRSCWNQIQVDRLFNIMWMLLLLVMVVMNWIMYS
jgi:hypothetical protein